MKTHNWKDVEKRMVGMWDQALMSMTDISKSCFSKRHGPCPHCLGVDRYRFDNHLQYEGDGGAICSQCGSGDGMNWLRKLTGMTFSEAVNACGDFIGAIPQERIAIIQSKIHATPDYKYSKSVDHERCVALMAQCEALDSVSFISHGIDASFQGKGSFTYHPINMVDETAVSKSMCNVARLDSELSDVSFLAGGQTFGAVHVIGAREGNIYLTISLSDGWHAHHCTGREVWVCFTAANLDHVVRRYRGDRQLRLACLTTEFDALVYAEENALQVMTPNADRWSMGLEKAIKSAGEILDKKIPAD